MKKIKKNKCITILLLILSTCFCMSFLIYQEKAISKTTPFYEKVMKKHEINYLIVGDSIGRGAGVKDRSFTWFSQWEREMKKEYQIDLNRHSIVQSGATAYEGLYLFKNGKKPPTVDIVFLIFGENDRKYMNVKQFSYYYEGLIREIKKTYPDAELITITESCLQQQQFANAIKDLSNHYHANHIDMRIPFQNPAYAKVQLTDDFIHPNEQGYELYADSILKAIASGIELKKEPAVLTEPLTYGKELTITEISHYKDKNHLFYPSNGYLSANEKDAYITYPFYGTNLGVKVLKHEKGGEMDVYIDGRFVRTISTWWPIQKNRVLYVSSDLPPGEHTVTFISTGTKSANNKTKHHTIQLSSIIVYEQKE